MEKMTDIQRFAKVIEALAENNTDAAVPYIATIEDPIFLTLVHIYTMEKLSGAPLSAQPLEVIEQFQTMITLQTMLENAEIIQLSDEEMQELAESLAQ